LILVDSSVWIDFFRGANSPQRQTLHRLIESEADISITEIIMTEILQGIKQEKDFQTTKKYLLEFPIYSPGGLKTYLEAVGIYRECRKKGKTIRTTIDCIIAAICLEHDLTLLHKDSDFDYIAACTGLKCFSKG